MTTKELRVIFETETGTHWENSQCEPDIDYVEWLESKIISSNIQLMENLPLSENCEHFQHGHCDCLGKYCQEGK